ncbi:MAG TPA: DUF3152 domain-containing protein [Micromonosporaceae bacterium]|jgi:hypothetical protein|nr:DUF3152 domain-containing protein [Micromonosporaceae bacterium]
MPSHPRGTRPRAPYPDIAAPSVPRQRNGRPRYHRARARRRRTIIAVLLVSAALLVGADLIRRGVGAELHQPATAATGAAPSATPSSTPSATPNATPTSAAPVLTAPGEVPASGPGTWGYGETQGAVLGTAGTLRRFKIAVETGAPQEIAAFAAKVDQALGDPRSWTGGRTLRLQRVPRTASAEFTIYLATPETARRMCAAGNVDIRVNGVPYTSCRAPGKVILNLTRWMKSVPDYINNGIPLESYRDYMINHETGHQLGYGHELCPGAGKTAPVMQTQTLGLKGCVANPWPYLNGKRYAGAPAPR